MESKNQTTIIKSNSHERIFIESPHATPIIRRTIATIKLTIQAIAHWQNTKILAHLPPSSRLVAATADTQGV
jgi:hypothetical protein